MNHEDKVDMASTSHIDDSSRQEAGVDLKHISIKDWMSVKLACNLIIVALGLGLYGYDNAFASPLVSLPLFVMKYQGLGVGGLPIFTANNLDILVTIPIAFAIVGSVVAAPLQNAIGRKYTLIIAYGSCCIPGSLLQLFAPTLWSLTAGRIWNYIGVGIVTNVAPLYLADIVPVQVRGRAVGLTAAGVGAVGVIATVVVWATSKRLDDLSFKIPLAVQVVFPGLLFFLSFLLTESPIWLLSKGRVEEARANLLVFRRGNVAIADAELHVQQLALASIAAEAKNQGRWTDMFNKKNFERTLVASSFISVSQVCGQILAGTYSTVILVTSGIGNPFQITILIFLLQFLGTLFGPVLIDRFGRRPVCLICFSILVVIDMAAGGLAVSGLTTLPRQQGLAALCILFAFFNSVSFGTVNFLLPTEIPTAALRIPTLTWSFSWSYVTAVITTYAVPQIISAGAGNLGAKAFLIFGGIMFLFTIFAFFYMPETANRTLLEIDQLYAANIPKRHWRTYVCTPVEAVVEERKFDNTA